MKNTKALTLLLVIIAMFTAACAQQGGAPAASNGASAPSPAAVQPAPEPVKQTPIKIALNNRPNPPFLFVDAKNELHGYTIEFYRELEKKLPEYKFDYELVEDTAQAVGVDAGRYAFVGNFFKNPDREKKYLFIDVEFGYYVTSLITRKDRSDIKTLGDVVGKKLVPIPPSSGFRGILNGYNKEHPGKEIVIEDIERTVVADDLKSVASGKYDVLFTNATQFEEANKILNLDLKIAGVVSKEPLWIMLNPSQTELQKKLSAATIQLRNDGTLSRLSEKWMGVDYFSDVVKLNELYLKKYE